MAQVSTSLLKAAKKEARRLYSKLNCGKGYKDYLKKEWRQDPDAEHMLYCNYTVYSCRGNDDEMWSIYLMPDYATQALYC